MTNKLTLLIGAAALSTLAIAGPKSYSVAISAPTKAGSAQLAPGELQTSRLEGTNAIFTGFAHAWVTVPVKVENADTKFQLDRCRHVQSRWLHAN